MHSMKISVNRLTTLEDTATKNLLSTNYLLMLRRHKKDYLSRRDEQYLKRFDNAYPRLQSGLSDLAKTLSAELVSTNASLHQNHNE